MLLSEHVYCVATHSKWLSEQRNESASNVALSLKIPPWKLFGQFRWPQLRATVAWQLALQHAYSSITSCAEYFGETWNHPGDSAPLQPTFGALWLLAFPKIKITFEKEEISDHRWGSGKYYRAADGDWENSVRSQGAYFEGDWGVIVLYTMFLISLTFFNKYLYFFIVHGWMLSAHATAYMHPHF